MVGLLSYFTVGVVVKKFVFGLPVVFGLLFAPAANAEPLIVVNITPVINIYHGTTTVVNVIQTNRGYYGVNGPVSVSVNNSKSRLYLAPTPVRARTYVRGIS